MAAAEKDAPTQTIAADDTMGGGLSAVAIRRPIFTMMIMLGLIVLGIFSYRRLSIDQFPSVDIPIVVVQTTYPGASAETIEREVTERMEQAFNPVEGVDRITSQSLESPYRARTMIGFLSGHASCSGETSYITAKVRLRTVRCSTIGLAVASRGSRVTVAPASSRQRSVSR